MSSKKENGGDPVENAVIVDCKVRLLRLKTGTWRTILPEVCDPMRNPASRRGGQVEPGLGPGVFDV